MKCIYKRGHAEDEAWGTNKPRGDEERASDTGANAAKLITQISEDC